MTNALEPEDHTRVGYQDGEIDNEHGSAEIVYPNSWTVPGPSEILVPETVEQQNVKDFFTQTLPRKREVSERWGANTFSLVDGAPALLVIGPNKLRKRLLVWTPGSDASVFISPNAGNTSGHASGTVQVPSVTEGVLEFTHTGAVYAFASGANGLIAFTEETYA